MKDSLNGTILPQNVWITSKYGTYHNNPYIVFIFWQNQELSKC